MGSQSARRLPRHLGRRLVLACVLGAGVVPLAIPAVAADADHGRPPAGSAAGGPPEEAPQPPAGRQPQAPGHPEQGPPPQEASGPAQQGQQAPAGHQPQGPENQAVGDRSQQHAAPSTQQPGAAHPQQQGSGEAETRGAEHHGRQGDGRARQGAGSSAVSDTSQGRTGQTQSAQRTKPSNDATGTSTGVSTSNTTAASGSAGAPAASSDAAGAVSPAPTVPPAAATTAAAVSVSTRRRGLHRRRRSRPRRCERLGLRPSHTQRPSAARALPREEIGMACLALGAGVAPRRPRPCRASTRPSLRPVPPLHVPGAHGRQRVVHTDFPARRQSSPRSPGSPMWCQHRCGS